MAEQLLMATFILLVLAVLINLARLWSPIIWLDLAATASVPGGRLAGW